MKTTIRNLMAGAVIALSSATASANLLLEFITPDGTVGPNETVDIWLRLSASSDFLFDSTDPDGDGSYGSLTDITTIPTGDFHPDANNGAGEFVSFDNFTSVLIGNAINCSGSFLEGTTSPFAGCFGQGANYNFEFNSGLDELDLSDPFSISSGDSLDYLFGSFVPVSGGATAGFYNFFSAGISVTFTGTGTDSLGQVFNIRERILVADTCAAMDTSCDFTRTVVTAVPAPASFWLFATGLFAFARVRKIQKYNQNIS